MRTFQTTLLAAFWLAACSSSGSAILLPVDSGADAEQDTFLLELPGAVDGVGPDDVADLEVAAGDDLGQDADQTEPLDVLSGQFGEPCQENDDCLSGFCILDAQGPICTQSCLDECPAGFDCVNVPGYGADLIFLCVPRFDTLCMPCASDLDCKNSPDGVSRCVNFGPDGAFCGGACTADEQCPDGYDCTEVPSLDGTSSLQCVPTGGALCTCSWLASHEHAETACYVSNEAGLCSGSRQCEEGGLSPCDAAVPDAESCDGQDNDCDGAIDEELGDTTCGVGICAHTVANCDGGQSLVCDPLEGVEDEVCDGQDNDCDGETDEELGETTCGQGICLKTVANCMDGKVYSCSPFEGAGPESCDGLDNDCDGLSDEDQGQLSCGLGICVHSVPACVDGESQVCDPLDGAGEETCDGQDNDCDGQVDEGLGKTSCGTGICEHTVANCANGEPQLCDPLEGAKQELCDGGDNDCDGEVDEELGETTCGQGECKQTIANCVNGVIQVCNPFVGASPESCDGLDNDCDGLTDEELGTLTCGLGACVHTVPVCAGGQTQVCDPLEGADAEVCDGLDNDCDGEVDEEVGVLACGKGECFHIVPACLDGAPQECDPLAGAGPEACNGKDDDCDGLLDEDLGETTCGKGVCQHTVANCVAGMPQACDAFAGAEAEACDGLDNDCDGLTDEEQGQTTCGLGICEHTVPNCSGGQTQLCDPLEGAAEELCDGLDNDCDGLADEELGQTTCGLGICEHTVPNCSGGQTQLCDPLEGAAEEVCDNGFDDDCDGETDEDCPGLSCLKLLQATPGLPSGVYTIDPDGEGPLGSFQTWCDMDFDGGGWTYGAIVKTSTDTAGRTRMPGLTSFGVANANKLAGEFSVNLTGIGFGEVRIDNFSKGNQVVRSLPAPATWDATTYTSGGSLPAKRFTLADNWEFRTGYYLSYCGLNTTNIPICFVSSSVPVNWVCDTDGYPVQGWVDPTGGELCGQYYCKQLWRDSTCTSYVGQTAVYGFAVR